MTKKGTTQVPRKNSRAIPVGSIYGAWTTIAPQIKERVECRCICGITRRPLAASLRSGQSRSCGCGTLKAVTAAATTHGLSHFPAYDAWSHARSRCTNPKHPQYADYGGRGITMCADWIDSVESFFADMGPRPDGHQLDRKENDKGYSPENCRWVTRTVNNANRRCSRSLTHNGVTKSMAEWAVGAGLKYDTFSRRIALGWPVEKALSTPVKASGKATA
jgi:hypothetical protein